MVLVCGTAYHLNCEEISAMITISDYWKRFYLGVNWPWRIVTVCFLLTSKVKVKFSHTRDCALGPELIPVYRQSAHRSLAPGGRLALLSARPVITFPAKERHHPSNIIKLHCLVTEAHRCEQLAQGCYAALSWRELNNALSLPLLIYWHIVYCDLASQMRGHGQRYQHDVNSDMLECSDDKFTDTVWTTGCYDKVLSSFLLQHQPHRLHTHTHTHT